VAKYRSEKGIFGPCADRDIDGCKFTAWNETTGFCYACTQATQGKVFDPERKVWVKKETANS
jgi:hypothetical protein